MNSQQAEVDTLRAQLNQASDIAMQSNAAASTRLEEILVEERKAATEDRQSLLAQITSLVMAQGEAQDQRMSQKIGEVRETVQSSRDTFEAARAEHGQGMDGWNQNEVKVIEEVMRSRETLKGKLKVDWLAASKHNATLQGTTKSIQDETVLIVDQQMEDVSEQMQALDDFVTRARSQNAQHHSSHEQSLGELSNTVKSSYASIGSHFTTSYERIRDLGTDMSSKTGTLQESLHPLDETLRQPLAELREHVVNSGLEEYRPTGETPRKVQYQYPIELPRTVAPDSLTSGLRSTAAPSISLSPSKALVFQDASPEVGSTTPTAHTPAAVVLAPGLGLREIDVNINAGSLSTTADTQNQTHTTTIALTDAPAMGTKDDKSRLKSRSLGAGSARPGLATLKGKKGNVVALEGRENMTLGSVPLPGTFGQSIGRRRSPRNGGI